MTVFKALLLQTLRSLYERWFIFHTIIYHHVFNQWKFCFCLSHTDTFTKLPCSWVDSCVGDGCEGSSLKFWLWHIWSARDVKIGELWIYKLYILTAWQWLNCVGHSRIASKWFYFKLDKKNSDIYLWRWSWGYSYSYFGVFVLLLNRMYTLVLIIYTALSLIADSRFK